MRALLLRIHGRVQGVGFRWATCEQARARGLHGWVRNRGDASVEALVQGEASAVQALLDWARHGPSAARVDRVDSEAVPIDPVLTGFEARPTV